mmetsp:Transcript_3160/g.5877  ORF Transcript_3160/g.5877 Transcript_3160/m.5877 type:complete len:83 (-) Transcript_3160:571-819(-)
MRPTTIASEIENRPSSCHLRGATCLARSDTVMNMTVIVDMNIEAQGTTLPALLVIIHLPNAGYLPNNKADNATKTNCPVNIA